MSNRHWRLRVNNGLFFSSAHYRTSPIFSFDMKSLWKEKKRNGRLFNVLFLFLLLGLQFACLKDTLTGLSYVVATVPFHSHHRPVQSSDISVSFRPLHSVWNVTQPMQNSHTIIWQRWIRKGKKGPRFSIYFCIVYFPFFLWLRCIYLFVAILETVDALLICNNFMSIRRLLISPTERQCGTARHLLVIQQCSR